MNKIKIITFYDPFLNRTNVDRANGELEDDDGLQDYENPRAGCLDNGIVESDHLGYNPEDY